jgi:hypothetical protein
VDLTGNVPQSWSGGETPVILFETKAGLEKTTPPLSLRSGLFFYSKKPLKNHCTFSSFLQKAKHASQ